MKALSVIAMIMLLLGCQSPAPKEQDLLHVKSASGTKTKKVIMLVVDSLMSQSIERGIRSNQLPAFQYLIEHGQYYPDLISSFPTMSVTIDSSLLTGAYPDQHQVPGLVWYSSEQRKLINYGTGPMEVLRHGISPVLADALIHLNTDHLSSKMTTLYEDLERLGYKAGSVNGLIYRGKNNHVLSIPDWVQAASSLPPEIAVKGPSFMSLGVLSNPLKDVADLPEGIAGRLGLNNEYAIETVKYLVRTKALPDFLYVYLPDLDQKLHQKGPSELKGVIKTDQQLLELLQAFGSPEKALEEAVIMIIGDSGMTPIRTAENHPVIELPALLGDMNVLKPGGSVDEDTEVILAVNETMAYVYPVNSKQSAEGLARRIAADSRIDFAAWKEKEWIHVVQGETGKQLDYRADGGLTDPYKQSWSIQNDGSVLDLQLNKRKHTVAYGQYPDGLRRLSSALNSHSGSYIVVTAKPGYELADRSSPTHKGGGGHGAMRQMESLVPLIISGTDRKPRKLRIVDMKAYLLNLVTKQALDK
ncbi:alkaline phosphatase family protein [Paenibacillus sp. 1011MAR3C5]|uniref:alkaline phosphatase family protein n=1 Tax=Paenibacillus sp. 1011MAR3C5 TaxID=1675787 RepID=UPI000E6D49B5|nr:alkaline phosphatase family protein [Paenibacillus sp. 1011MAR3C5]RJE90459.1 alkaline phosphatase family protein [Paenibacillus sp. 1011MAR3C5]